MRKEDLGYTEKWVDYGFLSEEILLKQYAEFQKGKDQNSEHYRYTTFLNWLKQKETLTDLEVQRYIELALDDSDELMAGSAVKELFTCSKISQEQFELIKKELPRFGEWTTKLIRREELKKRINQEKISTELVKGCIEYRAEFNENVLIEMVIHKADEPEMIEIFTKVDFGKKIRNLAFQKMNTLKNKS